MRLIYILWNLLALVAMIACAVAVFLMFTHKTSEGGWNYTFAAVTSFCIAGWAHEKGRISVVQAVDQRRRQLDEEEAKDDQLGGSSDDD